MIMLSVEVSLFDIGSAEAKIPIDLDTDIANRVKNPKCFFFQFKTPNQKVICSFPSGNLDNRRRVAVHRKIDLLQHLFEAERNGLMLSPALCTFNEAILACCDYANDKEMKDRCNLP